MLTTSGAPGGAQAASPHWRDILQLQNKNIRDLASVIACPRLLETSVELPLVPDRVFGAVGARWEDSLRWLKSLDPEAMDTWFSTKRRTRLGYHFADCVEYLLRFSPAFHPPSLHVSQQVFQRQPRDVTPSQADAVILNRAPDVTSSRGTPHLPVETVGDCIAGGKFTPGGEDGLRAGVNGATTEEEECVDAGNLFEIQNGGLDEGSRTAHSHRIRMGNGPVIARGGGKSNAEDASNGIGVGDRHAEGTSWEGEVGSGQESGNSGFGSRLAEAEIAETSDRVASGSEMEAGKRGAGANGCEEKKGVSETEDCGEKALPVGRRKSKRQQRKAAKPTGKTITVGEFDILFLQDSAHASRQESGKLSPGCLQEVILSNERSPEGFPGPLRDNGASAGVVGVEHWELSVKFLLYVGPESKLFEIGGAPGSSRLVETKSGQLSCGAETPGVGAVNSAKADGIRQGLARGGDDGGNRSGERHEAAGDDVSRESGDVSNGADVNRDGADVRRDGARSEEEDLLYYFVGPHAGERLSDRRDRIAKQLRLSDGSEAKLVLADLFLGASEADGRASENGGAVVTNGQASETNGGASELNAGAANSSGGASGANGGASEANGRAYDIGSWAFRADGEASGSAGGAPQINSEVFRSNSGPTASGFASRASGRVPELNDWTSETDGSLLSEVETSAIKSSIGELCEDPSVRAEEGLRKGGHSRPSSTSADGPCSEAVSRTREAGIDSETKAEASRRSSTTVAVTPRAFVKGYLFYEHALWKRLVGRGSPDSHLELRDVVEETVDDSKPSDRPISDCAEFIRARSEAVEGAESLALASSEAAGEVSIEGDSIGSEGATSAPASVVVESMDDTSASVAVGGGNESEAVPVTGGRNPGTRYEVAERAALNPGHWVGWWTRDVRKFLGDPSFRESRWYIIPKMEWLSPVVIRPPAEDSLRDTSAEQTPRGSPSAGGRPPLSNRCTSTALTSEELAAAHRQINGQDGSNDGSAAPLVSVPDAPAETRSTRPGIDTVSPAGDLDALRAIGAASGEPTARPTSVESASRLLSSAEFLLQIETLQAVAERCKVPRRGRVLVADLRWEGVASEEGDDVSISEMDGAWIEVSRGFVVESTWPMTGELPIVFPSLN